MSYVNAAATRLVATRCACCTRPLLDAVSVEAGCGPECRREHGYDEAQKPANWPRVARLLGRPVGPISAMGQKKVANRLVYRIALEQTGPHVATYVAALEALGFVKIATRIAVRLDVVRIHQEGRALLIAIPRHAAAGAELQRMGRWDAKRRVFAVAEKARGEVWNLLRRYFHGALGFGPRGAFVIR